MSAGALEGFSDEELLPISALQHLRFCPRQCALIHIEGVWAENRLTAEGRALHDRVHSAGTEGRGDRRLVRGVRLRSRKLGLVGVADMVELHRVPPESGGGRASLPGLSGCWAPYPVEYKRGRPKKDNSDEVQLCAQALCLEEMMTVEICEGAIFYGASRKRKVVAIDERLRTATEEASACLRALVDTGVTPPPENDRRCKSCSLLHHCMPGVGRLGRSAERYLREELLAAARDVTGQEGER